MMKKRLSILFAAALVCGFAACSDDDGKATVLTSPEALVGKWQLVRNIDHYKEEGKWYNDVDYDVDKNNHGNLFFEIFESDGTFRFENYDLEGNMWNSGSSLWEYKNKKILQLWPDDIDRKYEYRVVELTSSKLVYRDYDDDGEYEESVMRRVE